MAIIRKSELRAMDDAALNAKLSEIEAELHTEISALNTMGKPNNTGRLQELKKVRARINTIVNERKTKLSKSSWSSEPAGRRRTARFAKPAMPAGVAGGKK